MVLTCSRSPRRMLKEETISTQYKKNFLIGETHKQSLLFIIS